MWWLIYHQPGASQAAEKRIPSLILGRSEQSGESFLHACLSLLYNSTHWLLASYCLLYVQNEWIMWIWKFIWCSKKEAPARWFDVPVSSEYTKMFHGALKIVVRLHKLSKRHWYANRLLRFPNLISITSQQEQLRMSLLTQTERICATPHDAYLCARPSSQPKEANRIR